MDIPSLAVQHETGDRFRISIRGHELVVDQPAPASGDAGPTPTELFVASLASCAAFYAHRFLARRGLADGDLSVACEFTWAADHTHVEAIDVRLSTSLTLDPELAAGVLRAADRCTVSASIRAVPRISVALATPADAGPAPE